MLDKTTSISEAASEIGVSAGTLRLWEMQRLFTVARDDRGHRRFTHADVERLRRISWWRRVGLNHHAIRRQLNEEDGMPDRPSTEQTSKPDGATDLTGANLRRSRLAMGLTLSQLSKISGLSVSFISSFERGVNTASPTSLARLAAAIEGDTVDAEAEGLAIYEIGHGSGIEVAQGIHYEWLSQRKGMMEPQLVTVEPGRGSDGYYQHAGEEFILILEGELDFSVQGDRLHLTEGSTLHFDSQIEHSWSNPGETRARALWVTTERGVWQAESEANQGKRPDVAASQSPTQKEEQ